MLKRKKEATRSPDDKTHKITKNNNNNNNNMNSPELVH